jgi:hypothetical protein
MRILGTASRRWLLGVTLSLGLMAAIAVAAGVPPADRTFATVAGAAQSLMSVMTAFIGVLVARDLSRATFGAGVLLAAAVGAFGSLASAVAVAVAPAGTADRWSDAATIAVGGALVQVVAFLVGTGFGLLIRRPLAVAMLATIVVPLGLYLVLGPARAWLTPYAVAQNLLSGRMSPLAWVQWCVVFLLWGVGLNAAGWAAVSRCSPRRSG